MCIIDSCTANLKKYTSSTRLITQAVMELFDRIVDEELLVRRINMAATHVITEAEAQTQSENSFEPVSYTHLAVYKRHADRLYHC